MKLEIYQSKEDASRKVSDMIKDQIITYPKTVLGLATGDTPLLLYQYLIKDYQNKLISFKDVKTFNLDEYLNLEPSNKQSYTYYMYHHLFKYIDINPKHIHIPSHSEDIILYDRLLKQHGPIDIQILGIGHNGHIGFNEPFDDINQETHIINLSDETIKANSRFFKKGEHIPKQAITMSISQILKSKKIILMAFGSSKSHIIGQLLKLKESNPKIPASYLLLHDDVTIVVDKELMMHIK
ncbi:MAG: glucosamine-6-phosphate deaminase [Acholeplasmataceae bacterium]